MFTRSVQPAKGPSDEFSISLEHDDPSSPNLDTSKGFSVQCHVNLGARVALRLLSIQTIHDNSQCPLVNWYGNGNPTFSIGDTSSFWLFTFFHCILFLHQEVDVKYFTHLWHVSLYHSLIQHIFLFFFGVRSVEVEMRWKIHLVCKRMMNLTLWILLLPPLNPSTLNVTDQGAGITTGRWDQHSFGPGTFWNVFLSQVR